MSERVPESIRSIVAARAGVVNLRRVLFGANLHPPKKVKGDE